MKILTILLLIGLSSCIHIRTKIRADKDFKGISERSFHKHAEDTKLFDTQYGLIIHGIGPQKDDYSHKIMKNISNQMNINTTLKRTSLVTGHNKVKLEKTEYSNPELHKRLVFYSIKWSDLTDSAKMVMIQNETQLEGAFHGINKPIKKGLMYCRVSDAFYGQDKNYLGPILETIDCAYLDIQKEIGGANLNELNLISGSYGSQIFIRYLYEKQKVSIESAYNEIDTTTRLFESAPLTPLLAPAAPESIEALFFDHKFKETTLNFYMLTNQLALMDGHLKEWGGCDPILSREFRIGGVNAVALRNTNDFLCYYLPKETLSKFFQCEDENITVTNSFYWNIPPLNNPGSAHTCVFKLKKFAKIVVFGSKSNRVKVLKKRK
ncbi:MAG: hypothetical protein MK066_08970 [Crocinitomicaceae bacterium]|nr:hypothetical protein [Crocinitomicaceae bacterium]